MQSNSGVQFHIQLYITTDCYYFRYVAAKGLEPRILNSTAGESLDFIAPFDTPQKWKRGSNDVYNPYTPEERFEMNDVDDLRAAPLIVLPTPLHTTASRFTTMSFEPETWVIVLESNSLKREANYMNGIVHV